MNTDYYERGIAHRATLDYGPEMIPGARVMSCSNGRRGHLVYIKAGCHWTCGEWESQYRARAAYVEWDGERYRGPGAGVGYFTPGGTSLAYCPPEDLASRAAFAVRSLPRRQGRHLDCIGEGKLNAIADALGMSRDDVMRGCGRVPADIIAMLLAHPQAFERVRGMGREQAPCEPCKFCGYDKRHGMGCPGPQKKDALAQHAASIDPSVPG